MDSSKHFAQAARQDWMVRAAAVGLALVTLVNVGTGLGALAGSTVAMSLGMAPEAVSRALAALEGALSAVRSLGTPAINDLIDTSRDAFIGALHSGLGAAFATATAVPALRLLRGARG